MKRSKALTELDYYFHTAEATCGLSSHFGAQLHVIQFGAIQNQMDCDPYGDGTLRDIAKLKRIRRTIQSMQSANQAILAFYYSERSYPPQYRVYARELIGLVEKTPTAQEHATMIDEHGETRINDAGPRNFILSLLANNSKDTLRTILDEARHMFSGALADYEQQAKAQPKQKRFYARKINNYTEDD